MSKQINIQGHRGVRGLYPENTLHGFLEAVKLGVHTIELDVVISGDKQVVVSHEAWMNEKICSLPDGSPVTPGTGKALNLYKMPYPEIKQYDCGKRGHPDFPLQLPMPAYKPLLEEVIKTIEGYIRGKDRAPLSYNIELKTEGEDGIFNPAPEVFVDLVYREIKRYSLGDRVCIQSFDVRLLQELRKIDSSIPTGLLVETNEGLELSLKRLGFIPDYYNPEFEFVNEQLVRSVKIRGMRLLPWTVNETIDMERLISLGVDGIITDYPDRLIDLIKNKTLD